MITARFWGVGTGLWWCCVHRLEVRVDDVLAAADGPLDNLHAAEAAGVVALLAALELVELVVCAAAQRIGAEVREVVPLPEGLDVVFGEWCRVLGGVSGIFVDLGKALDQKSLGGLFGLQLVRAPRP